MSRLDQWEKDLPLPAMNVSMPGQYMGGVDPGVADDPESMPAPTDELGRPIAPPNAQVMPIDEEAIRASYYKGRQPQRVPLSVPTQEPPRQQSAQPQEDAPASGGGGGFDIQRALLGMTSGAAGIQAVDAARAQRARLLLDQMREARQNQLSDMSIAEQQRKLDLSKASLDPASSVSEKARTRFLSQIDGYGRLMPKLKPMLDNLAAGVQNMSAADVAAADEQGLSLVELARKLEHDQAMQAIAADNRELKKEQIKATNDARSESFAFRKDEAEAKRQEREDARTERDVAAYGKEVAPIDDALFNADEALEAKKKVSTGKAQNFFHEVRKAVGIPNKDMVALESAAGALGAGIRHAISGGAVTPDEGKYLLKQLAELDQSDPEYDIKLQKIHARLMRSKKAIQAAHPRATGAQKPPASTADSDAVTWAKAHPDDARAKEILKLNGM